MSLQNSQSFRVDVRAANSTQKEHLVGLIVPIFPLFIFPIGKSGFAEGEKLRLHCQVDFDPGPQYWETREGRPNARKMTAWYKNLEERLKMGGDLCIDVTIQLPDGRVLNSKPELNEGSRTVRQDFTFDIEAQEVPAYKFIIPKVKLLEYR